MVTRPTCQSNQQQTPQIHVHRHRHLCRNLEHVMFVVWCDVAKQLLVA